MRRSHQLAVAVLCTSVCTSLGVTRQAEAQEARLFQNAWFWGVHGGATSIGTAASSSKEVGALGGEWMITRSSGGLYVAYDQTNFSRTGAISDASATNGMRPVALHNMHTASIAGVAFPVQLGRLRPYGGIGFALNMLGTATPLPDPVTQPGATSAAVSSDVQQRTDDASSNVSLMFLLGAQWQTRRTAIFAQLTTMPSTNDFLVTNAITAISVGVRYNFGTSIDR